MTLKRNQKEQIVEQVAKIAREANCLVLSTYTGMTNEDLYKLRKMARGHNVHLQVIQNNLARIGFSGTAFENTTDRLHGHLLYAFSLGDMVAAPRLIKKAVAEFDALKLSLISIEGTVYEKEDIGKIASLPSKDESISMLMATLQAPYSSLVRTLRQIPQKVVSVFHAYSTKSTNSVKEK